VSSFKPNYFQRRSRPQGPKSNQQIRSIDVQVIGSDGSNVGILPLKKAIDLAKEEGLDLIEISPNANPPVCKIMDMGKYKYDLQKKTNIAKKKQKVVALKEIKMRPGTDVHDYNFKVKNAKKFLVNKDKVKFTVRFKGREMQHIDLGRDLMNRIIEDIKEVGKVETRPKFEGRQMIMIIQPI
jgi:translation initiation factor IF-3